MTNFEYITYPDGSGYVKLGNNINSEFIFRLNHYEDLWKLNQIVDAYNNVGIVPLITIPCLIDAQADRRFNYNESYGLKLVLDFLDSLDAKYKIFHPHNPEVVEALVDNVEIIDNSEFIKEVLKLLPMDEIKYSSARADLGHSNLILMSSDAGGFKPLIKLCDKLKWEGETYSAGKHRKYDGNETRLTQFIDRNNFQGKDILIVDDICVKGGTFKGLAKLLKERNVGRLYLAVSHMTIENHKDDDLFKLFDKIFVTNSKFDNYYVPYKSGGWQPENLEIIKMF